MTFHTRAATDEIYDIFNQPLASTEEAVEDESHDEYDDDDTVYTSAGESTGKIDDTSLDPATSGDGNTGSQWSEFTKRHVHGVGEDTQEITGSVNQDDTTGADYSTGERPRPLSVAEEDLAAEEIDNVTTPLSSEPEVEILNQEPQFIPVPPEDYEPPQHDYRQFQRSQNRLPFMTPIVEKTESSLGTFADHDEDFTASKTPCQVRGDMNELDLPLEHLSSPFKDFFDEAISRSKISQPLAKLQEIKAKSQEQVQLKETPLKGPLIKELQCNPVDDAVRNVILQTMQPSLESFEGFSRSDLDFGRTAELRKFVKTVTKGEKGAAGPVLKFESSSREYHIRKQLGEGAFAPVYLVEGIEKAPSTGNELAIVQPAQRSKLEAIKMEDPPTPWEFYVTRQAERRLGASRATESIIRAYEMHLFRDECYLVMEYRNQGTLLDLVNIAKAESTTGGMDECLAMFFSVELLRTVEALHEKGLLHADLKADNCLVRFEADDDSTWSNRYQPDGSQGWNKKGVSLIDFGRGIDMLVFEPSVQFVADWKTSLQDCAEMREMRPWTYQVDYHGLAGIIHTLLFGKYIEPVAERGPSVLGAGATKTYSIGTSFKRWWQTEIWTACFDLLLNPLHHLETEQNSSMPLSVGLKQVRTSMEEWLVANADKGVGLKSTIRKMETLIRERQR
jgi:checkpoint serine/threonine-protein kinase